MSEEPFSGGGRSNKKEILAGISPTEDLTLLQTHTNKVSSTFFLPSLSVSRPSNPAGADKDMGGHHNARALGRLKPWPPLTPVNVTLIWRVQILPGALSRINTRTRKLSSNTNQNKQSIGFNCICADLELDSHLRLLLT